MAIHGEIKINGSTVCHWHAVRVFSRESGEHTYRWGVREVDGRRAAGDLRHQYSDGAVVLAQRILAAAEKQWVERGKRIGPAVSESRKG